MQWDYVYHVFIETADRNIFRYFATTSTYDGAHDVGRACSGNWDYRVLHQHFPAGTLPPATINVD